MIEPRRLSAIYGIVQEARYNRFAADWKGVRNLFGPASDGQRQDRIAQSRDMEFEWDDAKAESNFVKHGIGFDEAVAVFADLQRVDMDCSRPGDGEVRRKTVGLIEDRLFTVVYTERNGRLRLISARPPNAREVRFYGHR